MGDFKAIGLLGRSLRLRRGAARGGEPSKAPAKVEEANNDLGDMLRYWLPTADGGYVDRVTIGTSLVLIAVGAILKYAVTAEVSWVDLQTVGVILMLVGILGLILSLLYTFLWSESARSRREPDSYEPPTRRY
jgi:hypothetical protein